MCESQTKGGWPMPGHGAVSLADSTLADPMIQAQPNAFYAALRHEDPVHFDPKLNLYLVSRYADIVTVLRDPLTYSDKHGYAAQSASGYIVECKRILETKAGDRQRAGKRKMGY